MRAAVALQILLLAGRALADAAPRLALREDGEVIGHGLPAILPDGSQVATLEQRYNYDDSSSDTLVIEPVPPAQGGKQRLLVAAAGTGGVKQLDAARVRAEVKRANERLRSFVPLPAYQAGDKTRATLRLQQGPRALLYSPASGSLTLTHGQTVVLRRAFTEPRTWICCGFASKEDGGCRRPPETVQSAWGDDRLRSG